MKVKFIVIRSWEESQKKEGWWGVEVLAGQWAPKEKAVWWCVGRRRSPEVAPPLTPLCWSGVCGWSGGKAVRKCLLRPRGSRWGCGFQLRPRGIGQVLSLYLWEVEDVTMEGQVAEPCV